ncbi:hypothetical protein ACNO5E_13390 [Vibrio parahaemolyticus]|uniref:hypothetical protein n=1 Tax=Vibrio parahaemolyticus TaxID=670 RepID=UPI0008132CE0|nr:hypothetical protein [Vibrio parahaemolyticus]OCP68247.1 hypothetical protein AKH08_15635 [Vibrio parahaemolyticus]
MEQVLVTDNDVRKQLKEKFRELFEQNINIPYEHLTYLYADSSIIVKGRVVQVERKLLTRAFVEDCRASFKQEG